MYVEGRAGGSFVGFLKYCRHILMGHKIFFKILMGHKIFSDVLFLLFYFLSKGGVKHKISKLAIKEN